MNLHKPNKPAWIARHGRAVLPGLACLLLTTVGCNSAQKQKDDPLLGVKPQVNPIPPTTGASQNSQTRASVPPVPSNTSSGSTAALASLSGGRPLSISNPQPLGPNGAAPSTTFTPNVQPIPRDVQPNPGLLTTGSWGQPKATIADNPPSPAPVTTTDPFTPLKLRGASNHIAENVPEGVRLKVIVPLPGSPASVRIFEATARDTASAVQAVVEQIDQQK